MNVITPTDALATTILGGDLTVVHRNMSLKYILLDVTPEVIKKRHF